jgi:ribose 5-phosphate isomerase A
MSADSEKKAAAIEALRFIKTGQNIGLGTGSTANYFIEALAQKVKAEALEIKCVPTSKASHDLGQKLGLKMVTIEESPYLDVTIDGADEFDSQFRLIKGGGGAMLREKIVASSSKWMIVIADQSKKVEHLADFRCL